MMRSLAPTAVFDLDGTLADTAPDLVATLNVVLAREGLPALPLAEARKMIGHGARVLIERGLEAAGVEGTPDHLDELYRFFLAHYADHLCVETRLFPGVVEALDHLDAHGFRLAVCTNKVKAHSVKLLEALGLAHRFAVICGRDSFPYVKPDPRHLTLTIEAAGGNPSRAVMIGDSRTDIVTARTAEIPVVAVTFGYTDVPVRQLDPDLVIDHYDQLAAAVHRLIPTALTVPSAVASAL
ncbi:MAG TPA: phosphoglycolate phosphatase [Beijerinckiaceae bacterium]|jgi:phosphoglycolate phosphatase